MEFSSFLHDTKSLTFHYQYIWWNHLLVTAVVLPAMRHCIHLLQYIYANFPFSNISFLYVYIHKYINPFMSIPVTQRHVLSARYVVPCLALACLLKYSKVKQERWKKNNKNERISPFNSTAKLNLNFHYIFSLTTTTADKKMEKQKNDFSIF